MESGWQNTVTESKRWNQNKREIRVCTNKYKHGINNNDDQVCKWKDKKINKELKITMTKYASETDKKINKVNTESTRDTICRISGI